MEQTTTRAKVADKKGTKAPVLVLALVLAMILVAAAPAFAQQGPITATGVLVGPVEDNDPDPTPVYELTDQTTGTTYRLISGFVNLQDFVGQRVTIVGVRVPGPGAPGAPLLLNVTEVTTAGGQQAGRYIVGTSGGDRLVGGSGPDLIEGLGGHDALYGLLGDDALYGGYDHDALYGYYGDDALYGFYGNDALYGYYGDDALYGYYGDDALYGGPGSDALYGYSGNDYLYSAGDNNVDIVSGGPGNDACVVGLEDRAYTSGCEELYVVR